MEDTSKLTDHEWMLLGDKGQKMTLWQCNKCYGVVSNEGKAAPSPKALVPYFRTMGDMRMMNCVECSAWKIMES